MKNNNKNKNNIIAPIVIIGLSVYIAGQLGFSFNALSEDPIHMNQTWNTITPLYTDWQDSQKFVCEKWLPATSSVIAGEAFEQAGTGCTTTKIRKVQKREQNNTTAEVRFVGPVESEIDQINYRSTTRPSVGTQQGFILPFAKSAGSTTIKDLGMITGLYGIKPNTTGTIIKSPDGAFRVNAYFQKSNKTCEFRYGSSEWKEGVPASPAAIAWVSQYKNVYVYDTFGKLFKKYTAKNTSLIGGSFEQVVTVPCEDADATYGKPTHYSKIIFAAE
jgi:hypothetical protein